MRGRLWCNDRDLNATTTDAIEAIKAHNLPPDLFVRSRSIVKIRDENDTPYICDLSDAGGTGSAIGGFAWGVPELADGHDLGSCALEHLVEF